MLGCCCGERRHDRGRADLKYHVGHQLLGQFVEEGLAKRGKLDDQGIDVATKTAVLDSETSQISRNKERFACLDGHILYVRRNPSL